jgi:hypothetical protein
MFVEQFFHFCAVHHRLSLSISSNDVFMFIPWIAAITCHPSHKEYRVISSGLGRISMEF